MSGCQTPIRRGDRRDVAWRSLHRLRFGVTLKVEQLDVTDEGDRKKALGWDVEMLRHTGDTSHAALNIASAMKAT
jgi:hypothetical protein